MDFGIRDDYLDDDDDGIMYSTKTYCSDSDDDQTEIAALCKAYKKKHGKKEHNEELDDFEKEMADELETTMNGLRASISNSITCESDEKNKVYYDAIYFDSDESDDESQPNCNSRKSKHKILTNDDLFYDPDQDDEDQAWVDKVRRQYSVKNKKNRGKNIQKPLPQSDAVLNCPACFTTLCLDCQRHEIYKNQYRAMFVFNCKTDKEEILSFPVKENKKNAFKNKKKSTSQLKKMNKNDEQIDKNVNLNEQIDKNVNLNEQIDKNVILNEQLGKNEMDTVENQQSATDNFYPVRCEICNTKVGVQDFEELYHFFNVLSSY